ncbi:MAG: family 16 glycosylhydrolase [Chitinophagaceae bacterium]
MRLLPFSLIICIVSVSFCAQKETPAPPPIAEVTTPTVPTTPTPPTPTIDTTRKLVWSDEFNKDGAPDSTKWAYNIGTGSNGWGNNEAQFYTNELTNARIENGKLIIEARKENKGGKSYTSARLITLGKTTWTYGRIEVRAKIPKGFGTWPAIWMLGENINSVGWPACGEIDIMEHVGKDQDVMFWSIHTKRLNWTLGTQQTFSKRINGISNDFRVFKLDWTKERLQFYIDDVLYFTVNNDGRGVDFYPFIAPQYLLMNLAIGGNFGGSTIDDSIFPVRMEVDYVRVYQ